MAKEELVLLYQLDATSEKGLKSGRFSPGIISGLRRSAMPCSIRPSGTWLNCLATHHTLRNMTASRSLTRSC